MNVGVRHLKFSPEIKKKVTKFDEILFCFMLRVCFSVCPNIFNNNHLFMAKSLIDLGKKTEAQEFIKKCLVLTEDKKTERESLDNVEEAKKLAKKIGLKL